MWKKLENVKQLEKHVTKFWKKNVRYEKNPGNVKQIEKYAKNFVKTIKFWKKSWKCETSWEICNKILKKSWKCETNWEISLKIWKNYKNLKNL